MPAKLARPRGFAYTINGVLHRQAELDDLILRSLAAEDLPAGPSIAALVAHWGDPSWRTTSLTKVLQRRLTTLVRKNHLQHLGAGRYSPTRT